MIFVFRGTLEIRTKIKLTALYEQKIKLNKKKDFGWGLWLNNN